MLKKTGQIQMVLVDISVFWGDNQGERDLFSGKYKEQNGRKTDVFWVCSTVQIQNTNVFTPMAHCISWRWKGRYPFQPLFLLGGSLLPPKSAT